MAIKILFTADNHIGISYSSFPKSKQQLLDERIRSFENMVQYANDNHMNYFIIGGDLFDKTSVGDKKIKEITSILKKFEGELAVVIPGNHDFYETSANSLWSKFCENVNPEKVVVLKEYEMFDHKLGDQLIHFYPAGCRSIHSDKNMIGWIDKAEKNKESINIGIAHGNVSDLGIDDADRYFNMTKDELKSCNMDLWLLGHIHVPYPLNDIVTENPELFMAGTHMPDSWKYKHDGNAWHIEIDDKKKVNAKRFKPTETKINDINYNVNSKSDIDLLEKKLNEYNKAQTALRLTIKGRLDEDNKKHLIELIKTKESEFLTLDFTDQVSKKIDGSLINQHYPNGSLPHVLLTELLNEDPNGTVIQKAFEILDKVKSD